MNPLVWTIVLSILAVWHIGCTCSSKKLNESDTAVDSGHADTESDSKTDNGGELFIDCDGVEVFADPQLESAVRAAINWQVFFKPDLFEGELSSELLNRVKIIGGEGYNKGIKRLDGIQCLVNLESANFRSNNIEDLEPLVGMEKLGYLYLSDNKVEDLSPMETLDSLSYLEIANNNIEDLGPLVGLPKLGGVLANDNFIQDASAAALIPKLDSLNLSRNPLENIETLANATELKRLDLDDCGISSLDWIVGLTKLWHFSGMDNEISNALPLSGLASLTNLYLEGNEIEDISFISELKSLIFITLANNRIVVLSPFDSLNPTAKLRVCRPEAESMSCDLDFDLHGNRIEDLTPLMPFIEQYENPSLDVSKNSVQDLSLLSGLSTMSWLKAADNFIRDGGGLVGVKFQEGFDLTNNRLESLSFLELMEQCGALGNVNSIFVSGNPLDEIAILYEAPMLCDKSVPLYWSDGEYCDWITYPAVPTPWDPDPQPNTGAVAQPKSCGIERLWLADGKLPGVAHHGASLQPNETTTGEPIVADELTGLIWHRCSIGQTWNGTSCNGKPSMMSRKDAEIVCAEPFAGVNDWRVPEVTELLSLVDYSQPINEPSLDMVAFPGSFSGRYLTSPVIAGSNTMVPWQVNFYNGSLVASRDSAAVRCVRSDKTARPDTRYRVDPTGSVFDIWTGLSWRQCAVGQTQSANVCIGEATVLGKDEAESICKETWEGHSDWRLPEIDELASLVSYCVHDPAMSSEAFPGAPRGDFWTATNVPNDAKRWVVRMSWGQLYFVDEENLAARVRCVRGP